MKKTIKIEKGIPIPNRSNLAIYPFDKMQVGDSFFVFIEKGKKINSLQAQLSNNSREWAENKKKKVKFKTKQFPTGVRVWRIK